MDLDDAGEGAPALGPIEARQEVLAAGALLFDVFDQKARIRRHLDVIGHVIFLPGYRPLLFNSD